LTTRPGIVAADVAAAPLHLLHHVIDGATIAGARAAIRDSLPLTPT
jgi:hypothetical protein